MMYENEKIKLLELKGQLNDLILQLYEKMLEEGEIPTEEEDVIITDAVSRALIWKLND